MPFIAIAKQCEVGKPMYYVYLIRSLKDSSKTYVGYTTNLKERFETHNSGGSIHTKQHRPWKLIGLETV